MASSAWAWLGFFWASSGLLLLGFFCFFFFWCLVFFFFWRLAVPPASDWRLPFHSFLPFFMGGGGFLFPAARTPSPADESLRTRPALCYCQRGGELGGSLAVVAGGNPSDPVPCSAGNGEP
jgi:hypothetical protein